tara:strand:+ start:351 stop:476 length:126 start_codon:yes stop_codon:yes gene_type:complete
MKNKETEREGERFLRHTYIGVYIYEGERRERVMGERRYDRV